VLLVTLLVLLPNSADLLLERLSTHLSPIELFRLNAITRSQPSHFNRMSEFIYKERGSVNNYDIPSLQKILAYRVVVTTCCTAAVLNGIGVPGGHFTHVFIDEAGQALEPEALIPLNTFCHPATTQIVLAGDQYVNLISANNLDPSFIHPLHASLALVFRSLSA
jgi:helicase MOV-10